MIADKILILADLDRTIIPNGDQDESAPARPLLRALAADENVDIVYITGRSLALLQGAVAEYDLPLPAYGVCDVGTVIYRSAPWQWEDLAEWRESFQGGFPAALRRDLAAALAPSPAFVLQEEDKQTPYKLSFYWDPGRGDPMAELALRLGPMAAAVNVVASVDETSNQGLLDLLPPKADKLHAARFLLGFLGVNRRRTIFAGDSGNDLEVLASEIPAVLVANAAGAVRREALRRSDASGHADLLYLARGGFMGMNGNYSAGLLEGLVHFIPETEALLDRLKR